MISDQIELNSGQLPILILEIKNYVNIVFAQATTYCHYKRFVDVHDSTNRDPYTAFVQLEQQQHQLK